MTITTKPARNEYTATAGQTIFTYKFKIYSVTDLNVYSTPAGQECDDTLDITTDYSVSGVGNEDGGEITFNVGRTVGDLITISSAIYSSRTTDYQTNGDFIPDTVNDDNDRVVSLVKQVQNSVERTLLLSECVQNPSPLSLAAPDPGLFLKWNAAGDGVESSQVTAVLVPDVTQPGGAFLVGYQNTNTGGIIRTVGDKLAEAITAEDFGVLGVDDAGMIQRAIDARASLGGGPVFLASQFYTLTSGLIVPSGVWLEGRSTGLWDSVFKDVAKTWEGTNLIFKGTGPKDRGYRGITSMKEAGGWREDPDVPGDFMKLISLMNDDASGVTPATIKMFSAAVSLESNAGIRNCRVVPWFGIDGYTDYSNKLATGLSDEWDVGILRVNSNASYVERCQVVGHWRIAGSLDITPDFDEFGRSERGVNRDSIFEGVTGFATRGGDVWNVTATSTTTLSIHQSDEHYWPSSGMFRGNDGVFYTYTGTVGTLSIMFTGVTPDPTGVIEVRNPKTGSGFAGDHSENCMFYALEHINSVAAETLGLPIAKSMEVSGFPLRGQRYYNCKAITGTDRCVGFMHDVEDMRWTDCQFEGDAYLIASPFEPDSTATAPRGSTKNIRLVSSLISPAVDKRLFTPRSIYDDYRQFSSEFDVNNDTHVNALTGSKVIIRDGAGEDFMTTETVDWMPAFAFVSSPTYVVQKGRYHRIGDQVSFLIEMEWTGLDTADTSSMQIRLPHTSNLIKNIAGTVQDKSSTGIDLSATNDPHLDILTSNYLIIGLSNTGTVTYNGGAMQVNGELFITGSYWIDS